MAHIKDVFPSWASWKREAVRGKQTRKYNLDNLPLEAFFRVATCNSIRSYSLSWFTVVLTAGISFNSFQEFSGGVQQLQLKILGSSCTLNHKPRVGG